MRVLDWLLEPSDPAVRHAVLRELLDLPPEHPEVRNASRAAMAAPPIAPTLDAQQPEGYWQKPGPGYSSKYRGTTWSLMFLDQLRADPADERIRRACRYVLEHSQAPSGGFGMSGRATQQPPPSSWVLHCLNGNLVRALVGFGWLDDDRVQRAIEWEARAITGEGMDRWYGAGTAGPGFRCGVNWGDPCAWGAIKGLLALSRIPVPSRSAIVRKAIDQGADFLLSRDPARADYPMGPLNTRPSRAWFKLGFPSGYVADVLQSLEALAELGLATDARLSGALDWLEAKRDASGRWHNEYAYNGKTWVDFERHGEPSKWVTLRATRVLRAAGRTA